MNPLPLRILDDEAFVRLRALLLDHGFTERGVCTHTGAETLYDFVMRRHARGGAVPIERPMDVLVRLFMDSEAVSTSRIDELLGADQRALLESFGLVATHPTDPAQHIATVLLYPTQGPWIVSDRTVPVADTRVIPQAAFGDDAVYPALTASVRVFLSTLPLDPVPDYLELCSGTGIAALLGASAGAERAVAVDITARSTAFATFNARLNALANMTALEGNLWEPVAGRQFQTIVAHPPYVPAVKAEFIYRDGGEDGEQVTRAIIEGLPAHLAVGGVFHCTCIISSRTDADAPHRVLAMLGPASSEYDLVFLLNGSTNLAEHFGRRIMSRASDSEAVSSASTQLRRLGELGVQSVDFCTIVLRRHGANRPGFVVAVERSAHTTWAHVAWVLAVGAEASNADRFAALILDAPATLSAAVQLDLEYRLGGKGEDAWVPTKGHMRVDAPFVSSMPVGMGDASMLSQFNGTRTLREHLVAMQAEGVLPADVDPLEFARSFSQLVLDGIVETEAFPLP